MKDYRLDIDYVCRRELRNLLLAMSGCAILVTWLLYTLFPPRDNVLSTKYEAVESMERTIKQQEKMIKMLRAEVDQIRLSTNAK